MTVQLSEGIRLYSGAMFDYNHPELCLVDIEDIAHALSNVCRFAGHVSHFYSVAQHAVNASRIVDDEFAFDALMHDTAEAFTNDIPTPLKVAVPMFKALEISIEAAMAERFGFRFPLPDAVKVADLQMLKLEKESMKGTDNSEWAILDGVEADHLRPLVNLSMMSPTIAKQQFLARFEELSR